MVKKKIIIINKRKKKAKRNISKYKNKRFPFSIKGG